MRKKILIGMAFVFAAFLFTSSGWANDVCNDGCTPGYWKQEHHFGSWCNTVSNPLTAPPAIPYDPDDTLASAFECNTFAYSSLTLLEALQLKGGQEKALIRHATAALLNAAHPDVHGGTTVSGVKASFCSAIASTNPDSWEIAKDEFASNNERLCPLRRAELEGGVCPQ